MSATQNLLTPLTRMSSTDRIRARHNDRRAKQNHGSGVQSNYVKGAPNSVPFVKRRTTHCLDHEISVLIKEHGAQAVQDEINRQTKLNQFTSIKGTMQRFTTDALEGRGHQYDFSCEQSIACRESQLVSHVKESLGKFQDKHKHPKCLAVSGRKKENSKNELLADLHDLSFSMNETKLDIKTKENEGHVFSPRNRAPNHGVKELPIKNELIAGIMDASFDSMFAIDTNGIIKMVNEAACRKFGWERDEILGKNFNIVVNIKIDADERTESLWKSQIGQQKEVQGRKKDGSILPLMLGLNEIKAKGVSGLFVAFLRDLRSEKFMLEMQVEKAKADALLLNMLPEDIASRLMDDPSDIAEYYSETTILFADIVGFTQLSSSMTPVNLVRILNDLFSRFDSICDKYELNKVKTIGDCYMVTSVPTSDQKEKGCVNVCHFAVEILEAIENFNTTNPGMNLSLRVGINSGAVIAGVLGTKRFMYDIWGDAVNVASRMESTGVAGSIQVTQAVVDLLPEREFSFEPRGDVFVKGKGNLNTFFLTSRHRVPCIEAKKPRPLRFMRRCSAPPSLGSFRLLKSDIEVNMKNEQAKQRAFQE